MKTHEILDRIEAITMIAHTALDTAEDDFKAREMDGDALSYVETALIAFSELGHLFPLLGLRYVSMRRLEEDLWEDNEVHARVVKILRSKRRHDIETIDALIDENKDQERAIRNLEASVERQQYTIDDLTHRLSQLAPVVTTVVP